MQINRREENEWSAVNQKAKLPQTAPELISVNAV
jgi:hypothetical protein